MRAREIEEIISNSIFDSFPFLHFLGKQTEAWINNTWEARESSSNWATGCWRRRSLLSLASACRPLLSLASPFRWSANPRNFFNEVLIFFEGRERIAGDCTITANSKNEKPREKVERCVGSRERNSRTGERKIRTNWPVCCSSPFGEACLVSLLALQQPTGWN